MKAYSLNDMTMGANYLLKPFKFEMIEELFEGWLISKDCSSYEDYAGSLQKAICSNWKNKIVEVKNPQCTKSLWFVSKGLVICSHLFPETLGDFIRDCQRAGIELEFKEKK